MDQRIDRDRLAALLLIEEERFAEDHPTSRDLAARVLGLRITQQGVVHRQDGVLV